MQQALILKKAQRLLRRGDDAEKAAAGKAINLITRSQNVAPLKAAPGPVLYPSEYAARADSMVEARRLIGGVLIEKVERAESKMKADGE